MTEAMLDSLKDIFRFVLQLPEDANVESVSQNNTPKWDSMAQVSLVAGIEGEFDVQLELAEAMQITSFETCVKLLEEKLGCYARINNRSCHEIPASPQPVKRIYLR